MKKITKNNEWGYSIHEASAGWGYYIYITDKVANLGISYEYSAGCGTLDEVETFLKNNTFNTVKKAFENECVYIECIEQIY